MSASRKGRHEKDERGESPASLYVLLPRRREKKEGYWGEKLAGNDGVEAKGRGHS